MREGRLRPFEVGAYKFLLADTDNAYQSHFRPVLPNRTDLAGSDDLAGEPHVRVWRQDDFSGGMGDRVWVAANNGYHDGTVRVNSDGLVLPPLSVDPGATRDTGVYVPFYKLGDDDPHGDFFVADWSAATLTKYAGGAWSPSVTAGNASYIFPSIVADHDIVYMGGYKNSGGDNRLIYKVKVDGTTSNSALYNNASATNDFLTYTGAAGACAVEGVHPVLAIFDRRLFALNGNDLWEIDTTTANTRTVIETGTPYPDYDGAGVPDLHDDPLRITTTDVGIAWIERFARPRIRHYNDGASSTSLVGMLPIQSNFARKSLHYSFLDDTFYAGFVLGGDGYLAAYGSTSSIIGPFESQGSGLGYSFAVIGETGNEILCADWNSVYSYDRSTGAITRIFRGTLDGLTSTIDENSSWASAYLLESDPLTSNQTLYMARPAAGESTILQFHKYEADGYWTSGELDFQYPGLTKILTEITVETDPLPTGTTVKLSYSTDGGDFREDTTNLMTAGATTYRWHMAADGASAVGKVFEIRLDLATTNSSNTPTIRAVSASVTGAERRRQWQLIVDTADHEGGAGDHRQASYSVLADLVTLGNNQSAVTFTSPFENRDEDGDDTYTVIVRDVVIGDEGLRADQALLVLEETELYPPSATDFYYDDLQG